MFSLPVSLQMSGTVRLELLRAALLSARSSYQVTKPPRGTPSTMPAANQGGGVVAGLFALSSETYGRRSLQPQRIGREEREEATSPPIETEPAEQKYHNEYDQQCIRVHGLIFLSFPEFFGATRDSLIRIGIGLTCRCPVYHPFRASRSR